MVEHNSHLGCSGVAYPAHEKKYEWLLLVCNYAKIHIPGLSVYKTCEKPGKDCKKKSDIYLNLCQSS